MRVPVAFDWAKNGAPSMLVPMVRVREVRVTVRQVSVPMSVRVATIGSHFRRVAVLMVLVVSVLVLMLHGSVVVQVLVVLGQMEPQTHSHAGCACDQPPRPRLSKP